MWVKVCAIIVGVLSVTLGVVWASTPRSMDFVSWEGIGPDKWASVWLIKRYVDPGADIAFIPPGSAPSGGIAFDVDLADVKLRRTATTTTFERIMKEFAISDPVVKQIGRFINEIEIDKWSIINNSDPQKAESAFRLLQDRYGRMFVPFTCYMVLFDAIRDELKKSTILPPEAVSLVPDRACETGGESASGRNLVAELPADVVLSRIDAGEKVVFVDAREPNEFAEFHIPNAVSLQLRDVDAAAAEKLADADLVVPYCVKDFRGYEVARAFQKVGLHKVAIMNPYGIKGWRQAGLPVAGKLALTEDEAARQLALCAKDSAACLKKL